MADRLVVWGCTFTLTQLVMALVIFVFVQVIIVAYIAYLARNTVDIKRNTLALIHVFAGTSSADSEVTILNKRGERIGSRPYGHPDIEEALATPGLSIRYPSGKVDKGKQ